MSKRIVLLQAITASIANLSLLVEHDGEHLNQIAEIQQQLKAAPGRKAQPAISE